MKNNGYAIELATDDGKGFATKADVLKFLQLRPEFQTQLQKLTQKKI